MANQSKLAVLIETTFKGKGLRQAKDGLDDVNKTVKDSEKGLKGLNTSLSGIEQSFVAVGAVGAVFKKAFDLGKEGAQIEKVGENFAFLTNSIGSSSDQLERLQQVTAGAVSDFDLMANANQLVTLQLADSQEGLEKHFEIVAKLKKPNDDFNSALENWSLTLANQSLPRLDSFGISSGIVRTRINELRDANKDLTREQAFNIAVMEQADETMKRLGKTGEATSSSFDKLETKVINLTNDFKEWLGDGLEPWAAFVSGEYAQAIRDAISLNEDFSNSLPTQAQFTGLIDAWQQSSNITGRLTGAFKEQNQELTDIIVNYADFTGGNEQLAESIAKLTGANVELDGAYVVINGTALTTTSILRDLAKTEDEVFEATKKTAEATQLSEQMERKRAATLSETTKAQEQARRAAIEYSAQLAEERGINEELADKTRQRANQTREAGTISAEAARITKEANQALRERIEAEEAAAKRIAESKEAQRLYNSTLGDFAIDAFNANEDTTLFTTTVDKLGSSMVAIGGRTSEQNQELSRLQGAYNRAAQNIRDYELGIKGTNLTTDKLNERIEQQRQIMNNAGTGIANLQSITGTLRESQTNAIFDTEKVNTLMFESVSAFGASAEARVAVGLATGQMTEAQGEAIIKSAILRAEIQKLAEDYANGIISLDEYISSANDVVNKTNDMSLSVNEATGSVNLLADAEIAATEATTELGKEALLMNDSLNAVDTTEATGSVDNLGSSLTTSADEGDRLQEVLLGLDGLSTNATHTTTFDQIGQPPPVGATGAAPGEQAGIDAPPKKALGGVATIGRPMIVGEQGAELFIPTTAGNIIPNNKIGASPTIHITVNSPLMSTPQAIAGEVNKAIGARG